MERTLCIKIENEKASEFYKTSKSHDGDSGVDLHVLEDVTIKPGETCIIDLGIKCELIEKPKLINNSFLERNLPYYLFARSSISKTPLILANSVGIIDSGYRGNIKAAVKYIPTNDYFQSLVRNDELGDYNYTIKAGTRLFQICSGDLSQVKTEIVTSVSETKRGTGGFGSTGQF
jgi:dUTP pyrophosphatase